MRILFLAGHEFLYKPQNGGQKCSTRNYRLLERILGKENVLLCMFSNSKNINIEDNEKIFPTHKSTFSKFINTLSCRNVCSKKVENEFIKYVANQEFDMVFVDHSMIGNLVYKCNFNVPIIIFLHNVEKNYALNKVKHEGLKYLVALFSYSYNERILMKIANKIVVLNKRDNLEINKIYKRNADFILPISFEDTFKYELNKKSGGSRRNLLFVGSLFQPNFEGIKWFVENVMVKLNSKFHLKIVGKGWEFIRQEFKYDDVEVVGTVDELDEYYYNADAVVLPLFYGDGMKVKTAEAMMYGKIILASNESLEGYNVNGIGDIYRCNTSIEYYDKLMDLYYGNNFGYSPMVREFFLNNYETKNLELKFTDFLDNTCNEGKTYDKKNKEYT